MGAQATVPAGVADLAALRAALADLAAVPPYEEAPEVYQDWGLEGEFRVKVGQGECAG